MCSDDNISTLQTVLYSPGLPEMMSWGERFRMWFITCYSFQAGIISLIMTRKPSLLRWSRRRQDPAHCLVLFIRLTQTQRLQKDCLCVSIERKRLFMVCTIASFCSLLGSNGHTRRFPVHAVSRYLSYCVFYDTVPAANWLNHAKGKKKKKSANLCKCWTVQGAESCYEMQIRMGLERLNRQFALACNDRLMTSA